jgi:hypothetical protein
MMDKAKTSALTIIIGNDGEEAMPKHGSDKMHGKKCPTCGHNMDDMNDMEYQEGDDMSNKGMAESGGKGAMAKMLSMRALKNMMK